MIWSMLLKEIGIRGSSIGGHDGAMHWWVVGIFLSPFLFALTFDEILDHGLDWIGLVLGLLV